MRFIVAWLGVLACAAALAQFGSGPELTVEVAAETDAAHAGDRLRLVALVTAPEGWHVNANKPLEDYLIPTELEVEPAHGIRFEGAVYPEPEQFQFKDSPDVLLVYGGQFPIGLILQLPETIEPGDYALRGTIQYQACNDTQCWMPTSLHVSIPLRVVPDSQALVRQREELFRSIPFDMIAAPPDESAPAASSGLLPEEEWREAASGFVVVGRNSGYLGTRAFLEWLDGVESGRVSADLNRFAGKSLWWVAVLTFLGGLALNLTPCVLPIIPVNLAIIGAGARARSKGRGFVLGAAYGSAITLVYGLLGLAAAFAGAAFGSINASPWFNWAIAVIFILLALAMMEVFTIDFSRFRSRIGIRKKEGGSIPVAFFMGGIAALLAGACVGPVVISVILFAQDLYARGSALGLLLPFLLGLGMALPWPLAGAGISLLPRPGAWTARVNQVFAALILLLAGYYGYEGVRLFNDRYRVDEEAVAASIEGFDEDGWTPSLAAGLERAKLEGRPVLIDFWATWCKNCLTMNKTTFKDPEVRRRLERYVPIKYQAQFLDQSPAKEVLDHFGVGGFGLPVYVIAQPSSGRTESPDS